jgi:hypothetical protein
MFHMEMRIAFVALMASTLGAISTAVAHHGFASYTDEAITVQATMTNFRFVNPHVQLFFDIENEAGEIEHWQGELTAPNKLARAGWTKNTFAPGDRIQITGEVARNDGQSIRIREIITADGKSLSLSESVD